MSWKDYQISLSDAARSSSASFVQWIAIALGATAFAFVLVSLWDWDEKQSIAVAQAKIPSPSVEWKRKLIVALEPTKLESGSKTIPIFMDGKKWTAALSLDGDLQRFVVKQLKRNHVDWGGVAVMNATTGEVLALASYSEKEPSASHLALRASFPAASVFKMVTAAAALEEKKVNRTSSVRFSGRGGRIHKQDLLRDSGFGVMTVSEAFAKSANAVFGKIGAQRLGGGMLLDYAERFGFNGAIPFDLLVEPSRAKMPSDDLMNEAEAAAGFNGATLSPLHGALMASAAVNGGVMMQPYVVQRLYDGNDQIAYEASPEVWRTPMKPETATEMRQMMVKTVTEGTAHKGFRLVYRDRVLNTLEIGGKTGSLTGSSPKGKNEWFVGYASGPEKKIAIGIVLVSEKYWRIRPSKLSRDIFDFYFSPRPILEASAVKVQPYGP